jgi:molybdate transport system substrate-binding protein
VAQSSPWIKGGLALCYKLPAAFPSGDQTVSPPWVRQVLEGSRWLAIANPSHAPYGKAAQQALQSWGLWGDAQSRLVVADSAAQAAQFLFQGAAQVALLPIGLVAAANMQSKPHWRIVQGSLSFAVHRVPSQAYQPIAQALVISTAAQSGAHQLANYLRSSQALTLLQQFGFERMGAA